MSITRFFSRSFLVLLLGAGATRAQAQDAIPLSLDDCIHYAMQHADTIKNARLNIELQKAQNAQITATALPKVTGRSELDDYVKASQTFVPGEFIGQPGTFVPVTFTPHYAGAASASINQTLFDGSLLVALQAKKYVMELVTEAGHLTEENLKYAIQRAYYAVIIAERQQVITNQSLAAARGMTRYNEASYANGVVEKIDVERSQVQENNLETDSLRTVSLLITSQQALKYAMGMEIDQPITLTDTAVLSNISAATDLLNEQLDYRNLTQYRLLEKQQLLNQYDLKRYKLAALPTLSIYNTSGYNYSSDRLSEVLRPSNYLFNSVVGIQLSVPIFNGFLRQNQVKAAKITIEKTANNLHLAKLTFEFQAAQAQTTLKNTLLAAQRQERNVDLAANVLDLAQRKFKEGVGSTLEVDQAQTSQLQAQSSYFQTLLDLINAQADLQHALGDFR